MIRFLSVVGARPQFVKAAMIHRAVDSYNHKSGSAQTIEHRLVHTGQHYERSLSDVFFDELPLPKPHHYLDVGSGPHGAQTAAMLERTEQALVAEKPDIVVVYGDTNSTTAAALAAAKMHIPLAHVEAGLRSFNRTMPEEVNRVIADHLSDILFCPTVTAIRNLKREGIVKGVVLVGDVMLDSIQAFLPFAQKREPLLQKIGVRKNEYILVTIHRAENTDLHKKLTAIVRALAATKHPVVFPMHPRLRDRLDKTAELSTLKNLIAQAAHLYVIEPAAYLDMLMLEANARLILTDSGGVQKEAYFLGVPCLTLRDETEWVETLRGGWNRLVKISLSNILSEIERTWSGGAKRLRGRPELRHFGGGHAANLMVKKLVELGKKRNFRSKS
jgi:UDP-N-acetylglucosamine 2-epimerase